jgi:hypothetical protein
MKMDLDEFFANHLDVYDQAVAHWNGCSLKEWFDGSEGKHGDAFHSYPTFLPQNNESLLNHMALPTELTSKFTECLDSVSSFPF